MTKEVMVTLSGLQLGDSGEDTVETVHIGEYYEKTECIISSLMNCWKGTRLRSEIC